MYRKKDSNDTSMPCRRLHFSSLSAGGLRVTLRLARIHAHFLLYVIPKFTLSMEGNLNFCSIWALISVHFKYLYSLMPLSLCYSMLEIHLISSPSVILYCAVYWYCTTGIQTKPLYYSMPEKSCSFLHGDYSLKTGHDFPDIQYLSHGYQATVNSDVIA